MSTTATLALPVRTTESWEIDPELTFGTLYSRVDTMYRIVADHLSARSAEQDRRAGQRLMALDRAMESFRLEVSYRWPHHRADDLLDTSMIQVLFDAIDGSIGFCGAAQAEAKYVVFSANGTTDFVINMTRSDGGSPLDKTCKC